MCSYVHTKLSLKAGLSNEDIKEILAGDLDGIPADESLAVLFAKDYAYNKETIDLHFMINWKRPMASEKQGLY
jgi:hypothetical protein